MTNAERNAVLSVTNEGDPIPPATRVQILQAFKPESLENRSNRRGLGLQIVHEIVQSLGRRIEIDDGRGVVRFRVVLPTAG